MLIMGAPGGFRMLQASNTKCQNGSVCTDLVNDYECACPAGYEGKDCEIDIVQNQGLAKRAKIFTNALPSTNSNSWRKLGQDCYLNRALIKLKSGSCSDVGLLYIRLTPSS